MHFAQHVILSWFLAEDLGFSDDDRPLLADDIPADWPRNTRRLVTLAGVLPDADVIAYVGGMVYYGSMREAFDKIHLAVHHRYTHGIFFAFLTGLLVLALGRWWLGPPRWKPAFHAAALATLASVVHMLCDVIASGPDWPVYPFWPVNDTAWGVSWSWTLADWPNLLFLAWLLVHVRGYGKRVGRTPVEVVSRRADAWLVRLFRGERPPSRPRT